MKQKFEDMISSADYKTFKGKQWEDLQDVSGYREKDFKLFRS